MFKSKMGIKDKISFQAGKGFTDDFLMKGNK